MSTMTREDIVSLIRDGSKYRKSRGRWERFWLRLAVGLILAPLQGLYLMLAVGVVHHEWWPAVPTLGFWWAVLIVSLLRPALTNMPREESKS